MVPLFSAILVADTEVKDMHDSHDVSLVPGETCHGSCLLAHSVHLSSSLEALIRGGLGA